MNTHDEYDWCSFVVLYIEEKKSLVLVKDNDKKGNKYKCAGGKKKKGTDNTSMETAVREIKTETGLNLDASRLKLLCEMQKLRHIKSFFRAEITEEEFKNMQAGHDIKQIVEIPLGNITVLRDKILPDHYTAIVSFMSFLEEY